tara:strand:+ start:3783 stop:4694 length:912 start_codon:yes stop_codon:yes gene_type:complete
MEKGLIQKIQSIDGIELKLHEELTKLTTLQLKSTGDLIICKEEDSLVELINLLKLHEQDFQIIGNGSNALLPQNLTTPLLKLDFKFNKADLDEIRCEYELPASTPLNFLTSRAIKHGFVGWNCFTGIPGSLGGAIFMNAGTSKGEISSILSSVKILRSNGIVESMQVTPANFSYRKNHILNKGDVIISAKIRHLGIDSSVAGEIKSYLKLRSDSQPLWEKTCGCTFKNRKSEGTTCAAGQIIDILGLKGTEYKGLKVSTKHGNFIENTGGATKESYLELVDKINRVVERENGYKFETEVTIFN